MARLIVSGASGYIGRHLVAFARNAGHEVLVLGRHAGDVPWKLGDSLDASVFAGVDAVIHLAHAWSSDSAGQDDRNPNIAGTLALAKQALAAGIRRFIFASTTSARERALNAYGRNKFFLEQRLADLSAGDRIAIARIALVYGGAKEAQYGLMRSIACLSPILPMIGLDREVQPIHVDEVSDGLLRIASAPQATASPYILADPKPVKFADWLKWLRKAEIGKGLILIPLPIPLVLFACDLTKMVPFGPTVDRERVLGLAGAEPMASAASLAELGLTLSDPRKRLAQELPSEDRRMEEAAALLRYLSPTEVSEQDRRDLTAAMEREGVSPLFLPTMALRLPALLALLEPPATMHSNRLARALHLTDQLIEARSPAPRPEPSLLRAALAAAIDLLTLPLRLLTSQQFK